VLWYELLNSALGEAYIFEELTLHDEELDVDEVERYVVFLCEERFVEQ
jgi:hypothetical protein